MTGHMKGRVDDAGKELCDAIKSGSKSDCQKVVERLKACVETESAEKWIEESGGRYPLELDSSKNPFKRPKDSKGLQCRGACEPRPVFPG